MVASVSKHYTDNAVLLALLSDCADPLHVNWLVSNVHIAYGMWLIRCIKHCGVICDGSPFFFFLSSNLMQRLVRFAEVRKLSFFSKLFLTALFGWYFSYGTMYCVPSRRLSESVHSYFNLYEWSHWDHTVTQRTRKQPTMADFSLWLLAWPLPAKTPCGSGWQKGYFNTW